MGGAGAELARRNLSNIGGGFSYSKDRQTTGNRSSRHVREIERLITGRGNLHDLARPCLADGKHPPEPRQFE